MVSIRQIVYLVLCGIGLGLLLYVIDHHAKNGWIQSAGELFWIIILAISAFILPYSLYVFIRLLLKQ
jgi:hypothetical protein